MGKEYILGIDIGGTKIAMKAFEVQNGKIIESSDAVWEENISQTELDKDKMLEQIKAGLRGAKMSVPGKIIGTGIGIPGRFGPDGIVQDGTIPQLGNPKGTQYNGKNIKQIMADAVHSVEGYEDVVVDTNNDANAMLAGIIAAINSGAIRLTDQDGNEIPKSELIDQIITLFTISTGLGNSFVKMGINGKFEFINDGHTSKTWVEVDKVDEAIVRRLIAARGENATWREGDKGLKINVEELVCGDGIARLVGLNKGSELDDKNPEHENAVNLGAKYLARLIGNIQSGNINDIKPEQEWKPEQKEEARNLKFVLLAAGLIKDPVFGDKYRDACAKELLEMGSSIKLVKVDGRDVGATLGAASTILPLLQRGHARASQA